VDMKKKVEENPRKVARDIKSVIIKEMTILND